jgi:CTP synthase
VPPVNILSVYDVSNIYHVPLILEKQGLHHIIRSHLKLEDIMVTVPFFDSWREMAHIVDSFQETVDIAMVGKYVGLSDAYLSVTKALLHSSILLRVKVVAHWIESSDLEDATKETDPKKYEDAWNIMRSVKGILVPGGFGVRGTLGKIAAAKFARENRIPYLGICLGMQIMVIEYARNVLDIPHATSTEFEETTTAPVVIFMPEINPLQLGGTMRLGARDTFITPVITNHLGATQASLASIAYGFHDPTNSSSGNSHSHRHSVSERHRHRYEVNPEKIHDFEAKGLMFTGRDDQGVRMEIAELPQDVHPFYFGTQFHPELKSRPGRPSPPFFAFVAVSCGKVNLISAAGKLWQDKEHQLKSFQSPSSSTKRKRSISEKETTPISHSLAFNLQQSPTNKSKTTDDFRLPDTAVLSPRNSKKRG